MNRRESALAWQRC